MKIFIFLYQFNGIKLNDMIETCLASTTKLATYFAQEVRKFAELEQVVKDINTMDMSSEDKRKLFKTKVQSVLELWEEKDLEYAIISTKLWALLALTLG